MQYAQVILCHIHAYVYNIVSIKEEVVGVILVGDFTWCDLLQLKNIYCLQQFRSSINSSVLLGSAKVAIQDPRSVFVLAPPCPTLSAVPAISSYILIFPYFILNLL